MNTGCSLPVKFAIYSDSGFWCGRGLVSIFSFRARHLMSWWTITGKQVNFTLKRNERQESRSWYSLFRNARSILLSGLPGVKGKDLLKVLSRLGYQGVRQRGSLVRLKCTTPRRDDAITMPRHDEIAPGILNDILTKVTLWKSIAREDLIRMVQ